MHIQWKAIIRRCYNDKDTLYHKYGGRGITRCDSWLNAIIQFRDWAYNKGYKKGRTLDRIDNDGNYEPNNCRWVDYITQENNRSNNITVQIGDERRTYSEWGRISGIDPRLIRYRARKGWPEEKILSKPDLTRKRFKAT